MISVAQGTEYRKSDIIIFTGTEEIPCPICRGELRVHGTCRRKVRRENGEEVYRLRVMKCKECGKTHRELPAGIVPYKRMDAQLLCAISEVSKEGNLEETEVSTWKRVKDWVTWFFAYAQAVLQSVEVSLGQTIPTSPCDDPLSRKLTYYVRLVVNSGQWIQHRSAMRHGM